MSKEKVNLTVTMEVTVPQALAIKAMFKRWNQLANIGSSQYVAFFVDGDGDFHPNCKVETDKEIPELTDELFRMSCDALLEKFDFDNIAWKLNEMEENK